jgi:UDP-N-acetylmuramoyl-L-alanyl-D-glutamate--2,6-diaminopimelate ligase
MWQQLKNLIRPFIPKQVFKSTQPIYHGVSAYLASWYFGRPSETLIVIGVTGTAGKSTTVNLLAQILNHNGHKTGFITTANWSDGRTEQTNIVGQSMPRGWDIQRHLSNMLRHGCKYAIIECTSEGLAQNRHAGINFDVALFTNLSPAHLDNHGGFENYKQAKGRLFSALGKHKLNVKKVIGANLDNEHAAYYLKFAADIKFGVTARQTSSNLDKTFSITNVQSTDKTVFQLDGVTFRTNLLGEFNAYNAGLAAGCAHMFGVSLEQSAAALASSSGVPGRMEFIDNHLGIKILVDYAPEPIAMRSALQAAAAMPHQRLIHVFGSTGGFRDTQKRFEFGQLSAQSANVTIITNDDVYDSDPQAIADNIKQGIEQIASPERQVAKVLTILDRRSAIREALQLAKPDDLILITGKGSEQFLVLPGNKRIPWDDRQVVREELANLTK